MSHNHADGGTCDGCAAQQRIASTPAYEAFRAKLPSNDVDFTVEDAFSQLHAGLSRAARSGGDDAGLLSVVAQSSANEVLLAVGSGAWRGGTPAARLRAGACAAFFALSREAPGGRAFGALACDALRRVRALAEAAAARGRGSGLGSALRGACALAAACGTWVPAGAPARARLANEGAHLVAACCRAALLAQTGGGGDGALLEAAEGAAGAALAALGLSASALAEDGCDAAAAAAREADASGAVAASGEREAAASAPPPPRRDTVALPPRALAALLLVGLQPRSACGALSPAPPPTPPPPGCTLTEAEPHLLRPAALGCVPLLPCVCAPAALLSWLLGCAAPDAAEIAAAWRNSAQLGEEAEEGAKEGEGEGEAEKEEEGMEPPAGLRAPAAACAGHALVSAIARAADGTPPGTLTLRGVAAAAAEPAGSCGERLPPLPPALPPAALLQALATMAAHAPSQAVSGASMRAIDGALRAMVPAHRVALLAAALPDCPYPPFVEAALGWVQRDMLRARAPSPSAPTPHHALALVTAMVSARLNRGLLLPAQRKGWQELLADAGCGGDALARRVSAMLTEMCPVDTAVLCLLRATLIRGAAAGALKELLPAAAAELLRDAYALPLMEGLTHAQRVEREAVGIHALGAHPAPFEPRAAGGAPAAAAPAPSRVSSNLSSLFLLESALAPVLALLDEAKGRAKN
jgi:hypothetical protein